MDNELSVNVTVMNHTGDQKINLSCDPNDEQAKKELKDTFKNLQSQGYRFYTCKKVMGLFTKKGKEIKNYDPTSGEMIYVKEDTSRSSSFKMTEVENKEKVKYEEMKPMDVDKEELDGSRDVVAAPRMTAG